MRLNNHRDLIRLLSRNYRTPLLPEYTEDSGHLSLSMSTGVTAAQPSSHSHSGNCLAEPFEACTKSNPFLPNQKGFIRADFKFVKSQGLLFKKFLFLCLFLCPLMVISNCKNDPSGNEEEDGIILGQVVVSFVDNIDYDESKGLLIENNYNMVNLFFWYRIFIDKELKEDMLAKLDEDSTIRSFSWEKDSLINSKELSVINFETKGVYSFNHYYDLAIKYSVVPFKYAWYGHALISVPIGEEIKQAEILEVFEWCRSASPVYLYNW